MFRPTTSLGLSTEHLRLSATYFSPRQSRVDSTLSNLGRYSAVLIVNRQNNQVHPLLVETLPVTETQARHRTKQAPPLRPCRLPFLSDKRSLFLLVGASLILASTIMGSGGEMRLGNFGKPCLKEDRNSVVRYQKESGDCCLASLFSLSSLLASSIKIRMFVGDRTAHNLDQLTFLSRRNLGLNSLNLTDGVSWSLTDLVRLRIPSSLTLSQVEKLFFPSFRCKLSRIKADNFSSIFGTGRTRRRRD